MTTPNENIKWAYVGDGVTVAFAFDNKMFAGTDVGVYLDGVLQAAGYSVAIDAAGIGNVTFDVAPLAPVDVVLGSAIPAIQSTDFVAGEGFDADGAVEDTFDRAMRVAQQTEGALDFTLRLADGDPALSLGRLPLLSSMFNKYVAIDGTGNPFGLAGTATDVDVSDKLVLAAGGTVQRSLAASLSDRVNVLNKGAAGNDTDDDAAAIQLAHDEAPAGSVIWVPPHAKFRVGSTVVFSRLDLDYCLEGTISPHGSFSDYLIKFRLDTATYGRSAGNGLMNSYIFGPRLDCLRQSRGVSYEYVDNSVIHGLHVEKFYGTAARYWSCRETSVFTPIYQEGRERANSETTGAIAWSSVTAYVLDDVIFRDATAWASGAYAVGDYVSGSDGNHYVCTKAATTEDPTVDANAEYWIRVAIEYYKCLIANTNKDPLSLNELDATSGNRYWTQIFAEEPVVDMNETDATLGDANNGVHLCNPIFHECDHHVYIRIDKNKAGDGGSRPRSIRMDGGWFHYVSQGYLDEYGTAAGQVVRDNLRLIEIGYAHRIFINDAELRLAWDAGGTPANTGAFDSRLVACGMRNVNKTADNVRLLRGIISGEGDRQTAFHVQRAGTQSISFSYLDPVETLVGSNPLYMVDPALKTYVTSRGKARFLAAQGSPAGVFETDDIASWILGVKVDAESFERFKFFYNRFGVGDGTADVDTLFVRAAANIWGVTGGGQLTPSYVQATPGTSQTNLVDVSHAVNTIAKFPGKMVWDTTNSKPVFANGLSAGAAWKNADGTTAHTPV